MTVKEIDNILDLNETQEALLADILSLAEEEKVGVNTLEELRDLLLYLEEKSADYPELNKMQLGIIENKVEAAIADGREKSESSKSKSDLDKSVEATAKSVAKTTAGTVGRQVGKTVGEAVGGSFGKTLGGNIGAELFRSIIANFGKK